MKFPEGFRHLPGYLDAKAQQRMLCQIQGVIAAAPCFTPTMPRSGTPFSVRMTNCGPLGWVSCKELGYRYQACHPETGRPWPPLPPTFVAVWKDITGCSYLPEAALVNWYAPGAKLGLHVDADEKEMSAPVVSISLGDDAWFRVGGPTRRHPTTRLLLHSGDVVVLGGAARLAYHGIDRIIPATSHLLDEPGRINITLRRVTRPSEGD